MLDYKGLLLTDSYLGPGYFPGTKVFILKVALLMLELFEFATL